MTLGIVLAKDSVAAGLYAAWQQQLWNNFLDQQVPQALHESFPDMVIQPLINGRRSRQSRNRKLC